MRELISAYTLIPDGADHHDAIEVVLRHYEKDQWAIVRLGQCLNRDNEWEWEPQPSSRDDDFYARCRFNRDEALVRARAATEREETRWSGRARI